MDSLYRNYSADNASCSLGYLSIPVFRGLTLLEVYVKTTELGIKSLSIPVFRGLTLLARRRPQRQMEVMCSFQSPFSGDLLC